VSESFRSGAREGFKAFLPLSVGLVPWALVTGVAMRSTGLSVAEAIGMNLIVFAGTAQIGTLPLIGAGAPLWLIAITALVLNLRFLIFSAALAPAFEKVPLLQRMLSGYLLVDGVFAIGAERMLACRDRDWRMGFFLAPSIYAWGLWQVFVLCGVLGADAMPSGWSLEFMATIALITLLVPIARARPMLLAALVGGLTTVMLRGMPLRLGMIVGVVLGIAAGFAAERWQQGPGRR